MPQRRPLVCKLGHASHGLQHSHMYLQSTAAAADTVQVERGRGVGRRGEEKGIVVASMAAVGAAVSQMCISRAPPEEWCTGFKNKTNKTKNLILGQKNNGRFTLRIHGCEESGLGARRHLFWKRRGADQSLHSPRLSWGRGVPPRRGVQTQGGT